MKNKHSKRDRSMTYRLGVCSYRGADEEEDIECRSGACS
jgi:hypothetical protein